MALRQLCDVAILLDRLHDSIDTQLLTQMLDAIGNRKAFGAFGCILVDKLGLDESKMPVAMGKSERKWGKKILDDILLHGNWGRYEREQLEKTKRQAVAAYRKTALLKVCQIYDAHSCRQYRFLYQVHAQVVDRVHQEESKKKVMLHME